MFRRCFFFIGLIVFAGCASESLQRDNAPAVPFSDGDADKSEMLPGGAYLKIYAMKFAGAATTDGFIQGAFSISNRPERASGEAIYRYELEVQYQDKLLVLNVNLIGADKALRIRDWSQEGAGETLIDEAQLRRWHQQAAEQAGFQE